MVFKLKFGEKYPYDMLPHIYPYMREENFHNPANIGIIHYYYPITDILSQAFMLSSYVGKQAKDDNGNPILEEIAMTEDDDKIYRSFLKKGMGEVFERLQSHSKFVDGAYKFDEVYDYTTVDLDAVKAGTVYYADKKGDMIATGDEELTYYLANKDDAALYYDEDKQGIVWDDFTQIDDFQGSVHYTLYWKDWWNENAEGMLDTAINSALVDYVLSEWFAIVLPSKAQYYGAMFENDIKSITQRLNTQKHDIRRPYLYF